MTYTYTRTKLSEAGYDINNPARVDAEGLQIYLAKEIESAFPTRKFTVKCVDTVVEIIFNTALTSAQKTTLDGIVNDHKNNI